MRYRSEAAVPDCITFVDLFWIVFVFVLLRVLFQAIWVFAQTNDLTNLVDLASFNNRGLQNQLQDDFNRQRWRDVTFTALTEAFIGFLIALCYLWYQKWDSEADQPSPCAGQAAALQEGLARNAIALLITSVLLVVAQWLFFDRDVNVIVRNNNNNNSCPLLSAAASAALADNRPFVSKKCPRPCKPRHCD